MEDRKFLFSQAFLVLIGELLLSAVMVGIFALLGYFNRGVLLGAAAGSVLAALNHTILVLGALAASKKAENQDVKGGQAIIQISYIGRLALLFLILVVCAKSRLFNLIALVLPLVFTRPILAIAEFFRKSGEKTS